MAGNFNNQSRNFGGQGGRGGWERYVGALPKGYLEGGYFDDPPEKLRLRREYLSEYPRRIADELDKEAQNGRELNKRSQIRRFYEYVLRVQHKLRMTGRDFAVVAADLEALLPHVKYAHTRKLITDLFCSFIEQNVNCVRDERDLAAFVKHFEALVAFTKKD